MSEERADVFSRALARWQRKGWARGTFTASDGAVCSIQCLSEEGATSQDQRDFTAAASELYPSPLSATGKWADPIEFNDYTNPKGEGRTASEIFAVTRLARDRRNGEV